jgi:hypothetical protein
MEPRSHHCYPTRDNVLVTVLFSAEQNCSLTQVIDFQRRTCMKEKACWPHSDTSLRSSSFSYPYPTNVGYWYERGVWGIWWQKRMVCVRIVASGTKWSLPTPKGNGRDVMFVWILLSRSVLTNPLWARVVGYGPFSLCVIHKEGLCPSSRDINRLMMMIMMRSVQHYHVVSKIRQYIFTYTLQK